MQPHEQHGQGVDQPREAVGAHAVGEQRAVGQGVLQVPGDQGRLDLLPGAVGAAVHHPDRVDRGQPQPLQVAQHAVLPERHRLASLLDRVDVLPEPDDPHHVPGQAAGQRDHDVLAPLLERRAPRERHQRGVGLGGDDAQRHAGQPSPRGTDRKRRRAPPAARGGTDPGAPCTGAQPWAQSIEST